VLGGSLWKSMIGIPVAAIWREPCACIDLDTERREKEKDASYLGERSVPLTTSLASGQLSIYMQHQWRVQTCV
jgi:hypothetical protein